MTTHKSSVTIATTILLTAALLLAVTAIGWNSFSASAQTESPLTTQTVGAPGTITVVGDGTVTIEPDKAEAVIGVETAGTSVKDASAENAAIMQAVMDALAEAGIAIKDMQTNGYNVYADRGYGPDGASQETTYRVSNNVNITIRDLATVGDILDAAIEAGANNIYGVNFSVAKPSAIESDARAQAVDDARAKAQELADLAGMELGQILSISEVVGGNGGYYANSFRNVQSAGLGGGGPITPGQLALSMQLQIVFAAK